MLTEASACSTTAMSSLVFAVIEKRPASESGFKRRRTGSDEQRLDSAGDRAALPRVHLFFELEGAWAEDLDFDPVPGAPRFGRARTVSAAIGFLFET